MNKETIKNVAKKLGKAYLIYITICSVLSIICFAASRYFGKQVEKELEEYDKEKQQKKETN